MWMAKKVIQGNSLCELCEGNNSVLNKIRINLKQEDSKQLSNAHRHEVA